MRYVFFGTPDIAVASLRALVEAGMRPEIVVTQTDKPAGRGNILTPPPIKLYAETAGLRTLQIDNITEAFLAQMSAEGGTAGWDCFVLVAFGMILPQTLLTLPRMGVVNMHPSLLPELRGPSPIRSAILRDARHAFGVTVMRIDRKMDHGPIIAQESVAVDEWPMRGTVADALLAEKGAALLAHTLPAYVRGEIQPHEQNHEQATYCEFIEKNDGYIERLGADPEKQLRMIRGYEGWPGAYTFVERNGKRVRVKITRAHITNDTLVVDTCIPEGKKEMQWSDFMRANT